jgi:hypothetical protein
MRPRIQQELPLLTARYGGLRHEQLPNVDWFLLPCYPLPTGWEQQGSPVSSAPIAFSVNVSYPVGEPYAFLVPAGLQFRGATPVNSTPAGPCPFNGPWLQLSWSPVVWKPTATVENGSNLLIWARSFATRLREGA